MKEMNYPNHMEKNVPSSANYLIDNADDNNILIHRELEDKEINSFSKDKIFEYNGKKYLAAIVVCPSEDEAVDVVKSYWRAIDTLMERFEGVNG
ncbi:hypothetical protein [Bacillus pseudomycoides]|uniref:hypothetical protein n=1 Tax=Bacillus pseudomycoides TaxID=64104 RepID=UPI000BF0DFFB|nr:hypothetical protein [Bacillus pseudomycoides]PEN08629.1 hypothetical protein CN640_13425 [Bacillus pseudomycoides]